MSKTHVQLMKDYYKQKLVPTSTNRLDQSFGQWLLNPYFDSTIDKIMKEGNGNALMKEVGKQTPILPAKPVAELALLQLPLLPYQKGYTLFHNSARDLIHKTTKDQGLTVDRMNKKARNVAIATTLFFTLVVPVLPALTLFMLAVALLDAALLLVKAPFSFIHAAYKDKYPEKTKQSLRETEPLNGIRREPCL